MRSDTLGPTGGRLAPPKRAAVRPSQLGPEDENTQDAERWYEFLTTQAVNLARMKLRAVRLATPPWGRAGPDDNEETTWHPPGLRGGVDPPRLQQLPQSRLAIARGSDGAAALDAAKTPSAVERDREQITRTGDGNADRRLRGPRRGGVRR